MTKLNDKQRLFVKEYCIDLNATQAALRAGYSARTARQIGSENLSKPAIADAIAAEQAQRAEKLELNADYFAARMEMIAAAATKKAVNDEGEFVSKEAADVAAKCTMDAAKLLGELVEKREETVITHEDRLAAYRERNGSSRRPTTH